MIIPSEKRQVKNVCMWAMRASKDMDWGTAMEFSELGDVWDLDFSPDGLTVYFTSWALASPINTSAAEWGPAISTDGRTLFFTSDRPGGIGDNDIWQVSLSPIVDLNADGIGDSVDMFIMVDNRGADDPSCDVGPMPWGDGIVDVQDLIVLAEYLLEEIPPAQ